MSIARRLRLVVPAFVVLVSAWLAKVVAFANDSIDGRLDAKATFKDVGVKTSFEAFTVFAGSPEH